MKDRALQCGFCKNDPVGAAGGIRLCARHRDLVQAIARDAGLDVTVGTDVPAAPRRGRPRKRRDLLDDDFTDFTPRSEPAMSATKTFEKTCKRSGAEFAATGPAAKYCGKCAECTAAANGDAAPTKKASAKSAVRVKRKAKRVNTGHQPRATTRPAAPPLHGTDSPYRQRLTEIEGELEHYGALIIERDALQQLIQTIDGSAPSNGKGHKKARR